MAKAPAGITSSVKAEGKTYILQTEFLVITGKQTAKMSSTKPSGKIVTTVAIEGQVVHKVEKMYSEPWHSENDFMLAEKAVKKQHISLIFKVFWTEKRTAEPLILLYII